MDPDTPDDFKLVTEEPERDPVPPATGERPLYLDHASTTPVLPEVAEVVQHYMVEEFGNAGSRTHEYGARALKAVNHAREQVAEVVDARPDDVIFTSGATEANNLATLGLTDFGRESGRKHIISTAIEHKAVLEPLEEMERRGFEVTLIKPNKGGWVEPADVLNAVRDDTLLISVMHVNNETGIIQPLEEIAEGLDGSEVYFHTDAAQGYGKDLPPLKNQRIDMISISGHKIGAPKGVGALILRRRNYKRAPLKPLMFGGGQERGLRPGTVPVQLVAGLGEAAALAVSRNVPWQSQCDHQCQELRDWLGDLPVTPVGDQARRLPSVISLSFGDRDSEATLLAWRADVAASNGAACTSSSYTVSHVLSAMGCTEQEGLCSIRFSWGLTPRDRPLVSLDDSIAAKD